jgi:small-conductance mechanosensitive channel
VGRRAKWLFRHVWSLCSLALVYNVGMLDPKLLASGAVVVLTLLLAFSSRGAIQRMDLSPEQRRRTKNVVRYVLTLFVLVGLAVVWAAEIQSAAIVASGFAVAIVLFNKDIILSVLGWWMKTASSAYRIGDRIRVGDWRGDVIDYGVLSTTLMEVDAEAPHGMRTGNIVTLPNALMLTEPVVNETRVLDFEWREVNFVLAPGEDWVSAEARLQAGAERIVEDYRPTLEAQLEEMSVRFAFHSITARPAVLVGRQSDGSVLLKVRMPMPARQIAVTADKLHRLYLGGPTEV